MGFTITEGTRERPQRLLIYGPEGIGKSTLASQMPDPVFIDVEDGTGHIMTRRVGPPKDWDELLEMVAFLAGTGPEVSTIVVDTADAAEQLCQRAVCKRAKKDNIEAWGYGKGYVIAKDEYKRLLDALDLAIATGKNVVLVAHSTMRKFERPDESGAYDRFELKLNKHVSALVKEWADAVLFVDWEVFVSVDDNGKARASGGKRIVRCEHSPVWDAKNRWGLPAKMPLDADGIRAISSHMTCAGGAACDREPETEPDPAPSRDELVDAARPAADMSLDELAEERERRAAMPPGAKRLLGLMASDHVTISELESVMVMRGKREAGHRMEDWEQPFIDWLAGQWPAVLPLVREVRDARMVASAVDCPF
ncbi:ATP-binding protein [Collinsella tanakaei]|uniref:ATP-binding protein n=1 Tax=Collinsella tanakaei TaxID=626935 RepID=UPI00195BCD45|nr:ATP-binding protein [Collinsella tanakaei]MBM6756747.1 ATP-binding protein [Collinsella tanakaei]